MDINIRYAENNDYLWLNEHDKHISENILKNKIENNEIFILDVEIWEFFRRGYSSDEQNVLEHFSEDFAKHINIAIETVRKHYIA